MYPIHILIPMHTSSFRECILILEFRQRVLSSRSVRASLSLWYILIMCASLSGSTRIRIHASVASWIPTLHHIDKDVWSRIRMHWAWHLTQMEAPDPNHFSISNDSFQPQDNFEDLCFYPSVTEMAWRIGLASIGILNQSADKCNLRSNDHDLRLFRRARINWTRGDSNWEV